MHSELTTLQHLVADVCKKQPQHGDSFHLYHYTLYYIFHQSDKSAHHGRTSQSRLATTPWTNCPRSLCDSLRSCNQVQGLTATDSVETPDTASPLRRGLAAAPKPRRERQPSPRSMSTVGTGKRLGGGNPKTEAKTPRCSIPVLTLKKKIKKLKIHMCINGSVRPHCMAAPVRHRASGPRKLDISTRRFPFGSQA